MADEPLVGDELKAMLRVAARAPLAFAFNPGKSEETAYFLMHKIKAPEALGRIAKKEGEGSKVAFGTIEVQGQLLTLNCAAELPGTAKKMKRFLKVNRLPYKVQVLDASGNLLEDDGEPLAEEAVEGGEPQPPTRAEPQPESPKADIGPQLGHLRELKDRIAALPAAVGEKLNPALGGIGTMLKAADIKGATEQIAKLALVIAKFECAAKAATAAPSGVDPKAAAAEDEETAN